MTSWCCREQLPTGIDESYDVEVSGRSSDSPWAWGATSRASMHRQMAGKRREAPGKLKRVGHHVRRFNAHSGGADDWGWAMSFTSLSLERREHENSNRTNEGPKERQGMERKRCTWGEVGSIWTRKRGNTRRLAEQSSMCRLKSEDG